MSRRRGRKHGGGHEEAHADERWLVSYADMITVLMCLFLVLFAMSSIDANKYAQLKDSLATGFGTTPSTTVDSAVGVIVEPEYAAEEGVGFTASVSEQTSLDKAKEEVATFDAVVAQIKAGLAAQGLEDQVDFQIDERGLTIKLVGGQTFFDSNRADMLAAARATVEIIGPVLARAANEISVEGHADPTPASPPYATNWELAGARSTAVLRYLVESDGVDPARISSVSFGSARATPGDAAANRRVDIVLLTVLADAAAELIPEVVDNPAVTEADVAPHEGSEVAVTGDH